MTNKMVRIEDKNVCKMQINLYGSYLQILARSELDAGEKEGKERKRLLVNLIIPMRE